MARSGLMTLSDAVDGYQQGVAWRDQQEQVQRQKKKQALYDEAGKAAYAGIDGERAQHVLNGGDPAKFQPSPTATLIGARAYGQHLFKNGDFEGYFQNEARVGPLRIQAMNEGLRQYELDKDPKKLIQLMGAVAGQGIKNIEELPGGAPVDRGTGPTVAPPAQARTLQQGLAAHDAADTNPLGVQQQPAQQGLAGIVLPGRPGDGRLGAPSGPAKMRVTLDNGQSRFVDPSELVQNVRQALQDPAATAERLARLQYETMLQAIKTAGQVEVEGVRSGFTAQRDAARAAADKDKGLAVAEVGARARVQAANISAASRDYRTDNPPPRAGLGGAGGGQESLELRKVQQDQKLLTNNRNNARITYLAKLRNASMDEGKALTDEYNARELEFNKREAVLSDRLARIGKPTGQSGGAGKQATGGAQPVIDRLLGN